MRSIKILIPMGVVFFFSTGASIIDNETKTTVSELSYKLDRLVQLESAWNKEQKDALQRLNSRMDTLSGHLNSIASPTTPTPEPVLPTLVVPKIEPPKTRPMVSLKLLPLLPYIVSGISIVLLIALFFRMRRGEAELRKRLWKNDMDELRTPSNPKIHVTGEFSRGRLP